MVKGQFDPLAGRSKDPESVVHLLLHTLPGRVLVVGAVVRLLAWLIQQVVGESLVVEAIGSVGTLALLATTAYFTWRIVTLARRRFLWRVRRKLILSFIFIGLVPALLIIVFFSLSAWFLFSSVSSFVLRTNMERVIDQARSAASLASADLSRMATQVDAERHMTRTIEALARMYPGVSAAVIPVERKCASELSPDTMSARLEPFSAGPWTHVDAPAALPEWIGCSGFGGAMAHSAAASRTRDVRLLIRSVALSAGPSPRFAVVLDVPIDQRVENRLRDETGVGVGRVSLNGPPALAARAPAGRSAATPAQSGSALQPPSATAVEYTDWETGRTGSATVATYSSVGQLYQRLATSRVGGSNTSFGQVLIATIVFVGALFLIIQFVALLMGLALARSITGSVHELFVGTERVIQGDFSHQIQVRARDQLGELADSFNSMTARLGQLLAEMAEKKRLEEELRIARDIQMSLLPQSPPAQMGGISLTALCYPAREVGGDYYDFLPLGSNRLGLLIADVSGKGTSAALYMAELKGLMLSLTQIHRSPRELLIAANRIISDNLDSRSFITMTYAILDLEARTMTWARAGHTPLIHVPNRGERRSRILIPDGLVLGLKLDNGERFTSLLEEVTVPLVTGDLFMFFTDGLTEQMNPAEDLFGEERLSELMEQHHDLPFDELRERIVREVRAFAAGAAQHDDMTFILLRVDEPPFAIVAQTVETMATV